ncbi:MAG: HipA domain-containing protein [Mogibacterium sp.]|nr:HipA domain-containing protein [Mogibacterium sp.]
MNRQTNYELLSGDIVCCTFIDGKLSVVNEALAPLYLDDFEEWVASRAIHSSRGLTARNLKVASGLSANEKSFETALRVNAACITDNYWVRLEGSKISYKDVSFEKYDGFFKELALGVDYTYTHYKSDECNPELTNIGGSDKAWVLDNNGDRWLYKRQPIRECYNEMFSANLAAALGIDTVLYELADYTNPDPEIGQFGIVRSRDFTQNKGMNLESAQLIIKHRGSSDNDILKNADIFSEWGIEQEYLNIKYLDILIGNPDRHSQNYGVFRCQSSGAIVGMAPNFDNNFAFLARDMEIDAFVLAAEKYKWKRPAVSEDILRGVANRMKSIEGFRNFDENRTVNAVIANNSFDYSLYR